MEFLSRCASGLVVAGLLSLVAPGAGAAEEGAAPAPKIEGVDAFREGSLLACTVRTRHLPGERIESSLLSGLPSAVQMELEVRDGKDAVVARRMVMFRIAFDLWEEIFRVESPDRSLRFEDTEALRSFFDNIPRVPIAPLATLQSAERYRVQVGLVLHPIAPRETERLGEWVAGSDEKSTGQSGADDGREVLISLDDVIRFFYRGSRDRGAGASGGWSEWFQPTGLVEIVPAAADSAEVR